MSIIKIEEIKPKELIPGTKSRFIHTDHMTVGYWEFEPGLELPEHSHPHEQVANIIEGVFEFTIDGKVERLEPGSAAIIPPNAVHSGKSITKCYIVDVFYPVREDFR